MKHVFRFSITILFLTIVSYSCHQQSATTSQVISNDTAASNKQINNLLDTLNATAARADYNAYFNLYTDDAIFTGTDATERWTKPEFMQWAKPYFDKGKAWSFISMQRHIYFDSTGTLAWFDELLNTQMKICRGSGVVQKQGNEWKIKQYILSATIPNSKLDAVTEMKQSIEDSIIMSNNK